MDIKFSNKILNIGDKQIKFKSEIIYVEELKNGILVITNNQFLSNEFHIPIFKAELYDFNGNYLFNNNQIFRSFVYGTKFNIEIINNHKTIIIDDLFGIRYFIDLISFELLKRKGVFPYHFVATWDEIQINGKRIKFDYEIEQLAQINNQIIISIWNMKTSDLSKQPDNGIFAYDKKGNLSWNVRNIIKERNFCGGFRFTKIDDKYTMILNDVRGVHYTIDLNSKDIIKKEGHK